MNDKQYTIAPSWDIALAEELSKDYMKKLSRFVSKERESGVPVYPPSECIFNAFQHTPFDKVRVVIMGQDPYHGPGQAHGLAFSVQEGVPPPPSLQNIFKELVKDVGCSKPTSGNLIPWADQGVFLLNAVLTVRDHSPNSHQGAGWERFTDAVLSCLCKRNLPLILVLWGSYAKKKASHVHACSNKDNITILTAPHPSPLSAHRGFFGCGHFSKINDILRKNHQKPIKWFF